MPLLTSLPFIVDAPRSVFTALFFAVTRSSQADLGAPAFGRILHLQGLAGIGMMLLLMGLIYLMAWRKQLTMSTGGLAIYAVFIAFNPTIFNQYFLWFIVFIPFALSDLLPPQAAAKASSPN